MLMFAHGFNIRFGTIDAAEGRGRLDDRAEVAGPSRPRAVRRRRRHAGAARRPPGRDRQGAGDWRCPTPRASACTRAGVLETTFAEETETDLFGEQAVLCGGVSALVKAGFETLVEAGYQPEIAYFECLHELKLIVDLMYPRRPELHALLGQRHGRVRRLHRRARASITDETRAEMKQMLAEIQDGTFAKKWIAENEKGRPWFTKTRAAEQTQLLEEVGIQVAGR